LCADKRKKETELQLKNFAGISIWICRYAGTGVSLL
jgi:hypothetical protein